MAAHIFLRKSQPAYRMNKNTANSHSHTHTHSMNTSPALRLRRNMRSCRIGHRLTALLSACLFLSPSLFGATKTWNGGGGDDYWSTGANWGGTAPSLSGDVLQFAGSTRLTPDNDFTGASFGTITFNSGAGAFTLSGNSVTLTGASDTIRNRSTNLQTINLDVILGTNAAITADSASANITIGGDISETGGARTLTKSGANTLTLSGTNTYTGLTTVSAGTLTLSGGSAIADSSAVTVSGSGTLNVATSETVGAVTVSGSSSAIVGIGTLTGSSYSVTNTSGTATISAVLSGSGALTKTGAGTLVLSGANTFSGGTSLSSWGTVALNNNSALGTGTLTVGSFTLDNTSGGLITLDNVVVINGNISFKGIGDNDLTLTGTVNLGGSTRLITVSDTALLTLAGVISSSGGGLNKGGNGTLVLSAANTYTAGTTIGSGTLKLGHQNALAASGGISINDAGVLSFATGKDFNVGSLYYVASSYGSSIVLTNDANNAVTLSLSGAQFVGSVSGKGGIVVEGSAARFRGALTYEGATWMKNGTLTLETEDGVLGDDLPNGKFILGTDSTKGDLTISRNGSAFAAGGVELKNAQAMITYSGTNGSLKITGNITNTGSADTQLDMNGNNAASVAEIAGVISDGIGGTTALRKAEAHTLILSGTNTYSGGTSLTGGKLVLNNNSALGTGNLSISGSTGVLGNTSGGLITIANNISVTPSGSFGFDGNGNNNLTLTGNVSAASAAGSRSITVSDTATLTLAGTVDYTVGGGDYIVLSKAGNGTLRLSGTTTVTKSTTGNASFTVSAGTLLIDGTLTATQNGTSRRIEVNSGATLGGSGGTVDMSVSVLSGGTLAPGTASGIGALNVTGNSTLAAGSTFALSLNATALTSDLLAVDGNISLATDDTTVLALNVLSDAPVIEGQIFTFLTYTGTWNNGLFTYNSNVLNEGDIFTAGANSYKISYGVEVANAFTLEAIPEPSTAILVFCGVTLTCWRLRRRR